MDKRKLQHQLILASVSVLVLLVVITVGTYAWFTFNATTRVEPMSSTISEGDASLYISNQQAGPFDKECNLIFDMEPEMLRPISTSNLVDFYSSNNQNLEGMAILYSNQTNNAGEYLLHGTVYLQSVAGVNHVYFLPSAFQLGQDAQVMSALRLGMQITIDGVSRQYIFRLDQLADGTPESRPTVPDENTVVGAVDGAGNADYVADSSVPITDYMAVELQPGDEAPTAGTSELCTLGDEQIATVEYWIYLEGCDPNCINPVQSKDIPIRLGFAGIPEEDE